MRSMENLFYDFSQHQIEQKVFGAGVFNKNWKILIKCNIKVIDFLVSMFLMIFWLNWFSFFQFFVLLCYICADLTTHMKVLWKF